MIDDQIPESVLRELDKVFSDGPLQPTSKVAAVPPPPGNTEGE